MICTFYSYKGGVGRSMALANVAELLYRQGLKVLMVDFDLEAPGLERYFNVSGAKYNHSEILNKRGIIDMLLSYKELRSLPRANIPQTDQPESQDKNDFPFSVEPLTNFMVSVYEDSSSDGELYLIPPGRRAGPEFAKYAKQMRSFDWNDFYTNWDGELFFEWFRHASEKIADVVLIDSRTGVTEMGGVCTYQLADVVIMFVSPNQQNMDGTVMMAESLSNPKLIEDGRKGRALSLIFVPSRIENSESEKLDRFADIFNHKFEKYVPLQLKIKKNLFTDFKIPYMSYYSYEEQVAVRESRDSAVDLTEAFYKLASALSILALNGSRFKKYFMKEISQEDKKSFVENAVSVPAENVWDAWNMLTLQPLLAGDTRYADCSAARGINVVKKLCTELRLHSSSNRHMHALFTGYRGDGKTTELYRFMNSIENEYRPLYFDAADEFDLLDFRFPDFLLGIARGIFERMGELGLNIPGMLLDNVANWFTNILEVIEPSSELKMEAGAGTLKWFQFITGKLADSVKAGGEKRKVIRKELNQQLAQLIEYVNKLLTAAVEVSKKSDNRELVVIFDSLDHLTPESAFDIFHTNGNKLRVLNCHFVYIIPISLLYHPQLPYDSIIKMQMIPVLDRNNKPIQSSISHLAEVLKHRFVPDKIMIEPDKIMRKFILSSGGHLRDLMRLFQIACSDAADEPDEKIDNKLALRTINELCDLYQNSITDEDYEYLIETYKTKEAINNEQTQRLIFCNVILSYVDEEGNAWKDVHPALVQGKKFKKLFQ